MRQTFSQPAGGFGSVFTPLGKRLLIIYGLIYILELIGEHWLNIPIAHLLQLYPDWHPDFRIWQIVTHPFVHDPVAPLSFVINCIVFYFFSGPVEQALGTRRFLSLFYLSAAGGMIAGLSAFRITGFAIPVLGMMPSLLALVVVFGLIAPNATLLLMFVLPVKAKYISYGTILITALTFLAKTNPYGAFHLGGIFFGYLFFRGPALVFSVDRIRLAYLEWQLRRKKNRFRVIDGEKKDNDTPTLH